MYNLSMSYNSTTKAVLPTQVLITNGDSLKNCPEKRVGYRTENRLGYRTANRLGNGAKNQASNGAKNQRGNGVVKTGEWSGQMETAMRPGVTWLVVVSTSPISYIRSSWVWLAGIVAKVRLMLQVVVACGFGLPGSTPTPPGTRRAG